MSVGTLVSPRSPTTAPSCWKKSPEPFGTPNNFGSCPTMIVNARPTMKPFSTGAE
jgi:hypothetical protein